MEREVLFLALTTALGILAVALLFLFTLLATQQGDYSTTQLALPLGSALCLCLGGMTFRNALSR